MHLTPTLYIFVAILHQAGIYTQNSDTATPAVENKYGQPSNYNQLLHSFPTLTTSVCAAHIPCLAPGHVQQDWSRLYSVRSGQASQCQRRTEKLHGLYHCLHSPGSTCACRLLLPLSLVYCALAPSLLALLRSSCVGAISSKAPGIDYVVLARRRYQISLLNRHSQYAESNRTECGQQQAASSRPGTIEKGFS